MITLTTKLDDSIYLRIKDSKLAISIEDAGEQAETKLDLEEISMLIWQLQLYREILKETKKE